MIEAVLRVGEPVQVGIVMGSASDLPVMRAAAEVLATLDIGYEMAIVSAHRTPRRLFDYASAAVARGLRVVIAGAGGAAHLPGMVAALTSLPVIGVPVRSKALSGQDSLLSIVQMPAGVPVATMAIDGAHNAGLFAARILGASDPALRARIERLLDAQEMRVLEQAERLARGEHDV